MDFNALADKVQGMSNGEVRNALISRDITVPTEFSEEFYPVDGVVLHSPKEWKGMLCVGQLEEIEHPGTPVIRLCEDDDGIHYVDSETASWCRSFPTVPHVVLYEAMSLDA